MKISDVNEYVQALQKWQRLVPGEEGLHFLPFENCLDYQWWETDDGLQYMEDDGVSEQDYTTLGDVELFPLEEVTVCLGRNPYGDPHDLWLFSNANKIP